jgi:hypothetical protein
MERVLPCFTTPHYTLGEVSHLEWRRKERRRSWDSREREKELTKMG